MQPTRVGRIREAVGARLIWGKEDLIVTGVATDSRTVQAGELFFALRGDRFDGRDFAGAALARGAAGVVVSRLPDGLSRSQDSCLLLVEDPLVALQQWARAYRDQFDLPVVGITGSTGKTSTKDMVARVLGCRWNTLATRGNRNNEIGLPLTLLELSPAHGALVVEMGMRGRGEIAFLCSLARPTCGVITNIGLTHVERLGSLESIAAAKGELLASLAPGDLAVLNYDDAACRRLGQNFQGRVHYYGLAPEAEVRAEDIVATPSGYDFTAVLGGTPVRLSLPLWGRHNVVNALAALALGFYLGLEPQAMARALAGVCLSGMRLEPRPGLRGSLLLNDTYNSNPTSAKAALAALAERRTGRTVAVLGDMLELGEYGAAAHREVGETAAALKIDLLVTIGELAPAIAAGAVAAGMAAGRVHSFATKEEALPLLLEELREGDLVLVKASRGLHLETLAAALQVEP